MLTDSNKDTIIETLTKELEHLKSSIPDRIDNAYRKGFVEGMRLELHVASMHPIGEVLEPGAFPPEQDLPKETLEAIRTNIRQQIFDKFTPVLPEQIRQWVRNSVHEDNLEYNPSFCRKPNG